MAELSKYEGEVRYLDREIAKWSRTAWSIVGIAALIAAVGIAVSLYQQRIGPALVLAAIAALIAFSSRSCFEFHDKRMKQKEQILERMRKES